LGAPALKGRKVLVTGATGFIGGRLVEKLILQHSADVRALVRHFGHAARLARFDLEMVSGSIEDQDAVEKAVTGTEFVFNLAYVTSNSVSENTGAMAHLVEASLTGGVRRLVHISTYSVYEPFTDGVIDEATPVGPGAYGYPKAKIAVEEQVMAAVRERGLPAVILRPTIVYGPFGGHWTDRTAKNLIKGRVVLPDEGGGLCNGVFVDDLVDAMILASVRPEAIGETFLISGPDQVTWRTYYETMQRCLGVDTLRFMERTAPDRPRTGPPERTTGDTRSPARFKVRHRLGSMLTSEQKRRLRRGLRRYTKRGTAPKISTDYDYTAKPVCRIDKARHLLGYDPKFDFEAGMAITCQYLRWAYPTAGGDQLTSGA
jgi:nucleoside-diphosphate-sugar epimerase